MLGPNNDPNRVNGANTEPVIDGNEDNNTPNSITKKIGEFVGKFFKILGIIFLTLGTAGFIYFNDNFKNYTVEVFTGKKSEAINSDGVEGEEEVGVGGAGDGVEGDGDLGVGGAGDGVEGEEEVVVGGAGDGVEGEEEVVVSDGVEGGIINAVTSFAGRLLLGDFWG